MSNNYLYYNYIMSSIPVRKPNTSQLATGPGGQVWATGDY